MYRKEIVYDRETRDYACYLDGELGGFAHGRVAREAEIVVRAEVQHLALRRRVVAARDADARAPGSSAVRPLPRATNVNITNSDGIPTNPLTRAADGYGGSDF